MFNKNIAYAQAAVAQWIEYGPANQRVAALRTLGSLLRAIMKTRMR